MKDYMDKVFSEAGLTDAQMTTNTYRAIKQVVQDRPDVIIGTELGQAMKEAAALANELKARKSDALMRYISDSDLKNAVACFNSTLTITQEVFGEENMTEAVICKAIEAGSYIAYRAIMGEAQQPSRRY
jgi:sulfite reductase alpha subunit-like flavoprotein